jgi:uncharacterized protein (TIGR04255 family)
VYPGREMFSNAPLEYVAAEIRYPYAPRLRQQETLDAVLLELEDLLPVLRSGPQLTVTAAVGRDGGGGMSQQLDQVSRAFNKSSTTSVMVTATALTIDTTSYKEFDDFREMIRRAVDAVMTHAKIAAIERIGLRYINEIRVPDEVRDVRDWKNWVDESLIEVVKLGGDYAAAIAEGAVQYITGDHRRLVFRYVASLQGTGVIGNDPLKRRHPPVEAPFFVLDLDSYWQPPTDQVPDFAAETIMKAVDDLHQPIGVTFQRAITDHLRSEVLRRP